MGSVSQWKAWLLAGTTLVAGLGLAVILYTDQRRAAPATDAPSVAPSPAVSPSPSPPDSEPEPAPLAPPPGAPAFDVVRVAEDGGALVAGSAFAGAAVLLRVDGVVVSETSADNAGQFVSVFTLAPSDSVQVMTLEMALADGRVILSADRVVLAPRPEAVAALIGAAPESLALATLPPEPSALPGGEAIPPVPAAFPQGQAPGHEEASAALEQAPLPADDQAALPAAERDLPQAATEGTVERAITQSAATRVTAVETPTEDGAGPATGPAADFSAGETTVAEGAGEVTVAGAEAPAERHAAQPAEGRAETTVPATQTPAPPLAEPDTRQAHVRVPRETPEPQPAPADDTAPRPTVQAERQRPGHMAAATVLEAGADAGIAVQEAPVSVGEAPAQAAPAPQPEETRLAGDVVRTSEPAENAPAENLVPRGFVLRGSGAVELLGHAPQVMDNVVIDIISYSDAGDVQITGRAASREAGTRVQIYLDNRPIAMALAEDGDWSSDLPEVDPGIYALRVDQLDGEGRVVSRFETPFQREDPALVRAARAQGAEVATGGGGPGWQSEAGAGQAGEAETASATVSTSATSSGGTSSGPTRPTADSGSDSASDARAATTADASAETTTGVSTGTITEVPAGSEAAETGVAAAPVDARGDPALPGGQQSVALITVQPGHSLWRISEGHYGAGERYLVIYTANRGQIRNPDLIYPGQIFVLPD